MGEVKPLVLDGNKKRQYNPLTDTIAGLNANDYQNGFFRIKSGETITVAPCRQSTTFGGILFIEAGASLVVQGQYRLRF